MRHVRATIEELRRYIATCEARKELEEVDSLLAIALEESGGNSLDIIPKRDGSETPVLRRESNRRRPCRVQPNVPISAKELLRALQHARRSTSTKGELDGALRFDFRATVAHSLEGRRCDAREAIMPHEDARSRSGAFGPGQLQLLGRVLKRIGGDDLDDADRQAMAQRVMANYMAGFTDEDELITVSKQPLGR